MEGINFGWLMNAMAEPGTGTGSASPELDTHRDRQEPDVLAWDEHTVIPGLSEHAKGHPP